MKRGRKQERISPAEAEGMRRVRIVQMALWTMTVLIQMSVVTCLEVRAEAERITITYDLEDSPDACTGPAEYYEDESGTEYELESWSPVAVTLPSITRNVKEEVAYDQIEGVTVIPEDLEVTVRDRERGQAVKTVCRMEEKEVMRETWQDDFAFTVTFHTYGAGYYQLADRLIPDNDEEPELDGCEELLLELAGVSPEDYRVTYVQWSGDAYQDEDGTLCRDAVAFGQRRICDYRVTYSGRAVFPVRSGWQTSAVYRLPETAVADEVTENAETEITVIAVPETEVQTQIEPAGQSKEHPSLWERITQTLMVAVAVGAVFFFGGLLLLAILRVVKKRRA